MEPSKRVFILGAGFSKPAGMPLATELLSLLDRELQHDEMREWLNGLSQRLAWLAENDEATSSSSLNIEQVFHYAHFDVEAHRLRQHLASVGRYDGETPWNDAESITIWLSYLEDALCDVILNTQDESNRDPVIRWAKEISGTDAVLTFNGSASKLM